MKDLRKDTWKQIRNSKTGLEYEISTIEQMGFVEYFLIVWTT